MAETAHQAAEIRLAAARRLTWAIHMISRLGNRGHTPDQIKRTLNLSDAEYERACAWLRMP